MAASGRVTALLGQLADDSQGRSRRVDTLAELRRVLNVCNREEVASIAEQSSLDVFFGCVRSSSGEEIEIACGILKDILASLSPLSVLTRWGADLLLGLQHSHSSVKFLCLTQLERVALSNAEVLLKNAAIVTELINLISAEDGNLHKKAHAVLVVLGSNNVSCETIFKESSHVCQHYLNALQSGDSVTWFRLMQVIVDVSKANEATMTACTGCGLLGQLLTKMEECALAEDILAQLCLLDMFSEVMLTEHGYSFLRQHGIVARLLGTLTSDEEHPATALLRPGILKLFAGVARLQPKLTYECHHGFYVTVCQGIGCRDDTWKELCIETLGFVSESPQCKQVLACLGPTLVNALSQLGHYSCHGGPSSAKIKAINTIARLIYLTPEEQTEEMLDLTLAWYQYISQPQPLLEHLLTLSRQPFTDLRLATLRVYAALALTKWGQTLMHSTPSFCEYLLDRGTELEKEGKELKFEVVQHLASSLTVNDVFDASFVLRLRLYVRQGPFFIRTQSEVATEQS